MYHLQTLGFCSPNFLIVGSTAKVLARLSRLLTRVILENNTICHSDSACVIVLMQALKVISKVRSEDCHSATQA